MSELQFDVFRLYIGVWGALTLGMTATNHWIVVLMGLLAIAQLAMAVYAERLDRKIKKLERGEA